MAQALVLEPADPGLGVGVRVGCEQRCADAFEIGTTKKMAETGQELGVAIVASDLVEAFADNFETDQGWTVSGGAGDGYWERGFPQGNNRGDPATDGDGSGQCYFTEIDPLSINSDVDDGTTTLTSPVFEMSLGGTISYSWWLNDVPNGLLNGDSLTVEVATDPAGTNWTMRRT